VIYSFILNPTQYELGSRFSRKMKNFKDIELKYNEINETHYKSLIIDKIQKQLISDEPTGPEGQVNKKTDQYEYYKLSCLRAFLGFLF
jgi:hypothetical protein